MELHQLYSNVIAKHDLMSDCWHIKNLLMFHILRTSIHIIGKIQLFMINGDLTKKCKFKNQIDLSFVHVFTVELASMITIAFAL